MLLLKSAYVHMFTLVAEDLVGSSHDDGCHLTLTTMLSKFFPSEGLHLLISFFLFGYR